LLEIIHRFSASFISRSPHPSFHPPFSFFPYILHSSRPCLAAFVVTDPPRPAKVSRYFSVYLHSHFPDPQGSPSITTHPKPKLTNQSNPSAHSGCQTHPHATSSFDPTRASRHTLIATTLPNRSPDPSTSTIPLFPSPSGPQPKAPLIQSSTTETAGSAPEKARHRLCLVKADKALPWRATRDKDGARLLILTPDVAEGRITRLRRLLRVTGVKGEPRK